MASKILHKESKIHGRGIHATKNIKKGEIVCIVKGPQMFKVNLNMHDVLGHPDWVGFKKHYWVDPIPPYKYLNHSCNPNTAIKGHKTVMAIHNIKKGDEVTVDYSILEADIRWYMKCSCGENNCRHKIASIQKLPQKIYNSYLPYISKEFQILYNSYHNKKGWKKNQKS